MKKVLLPGVRFFGVYSAPLSMRTNLKSGMVFTWAEAIPLKSKRAMMRCFMRQNDD
jgi:hypothetical protein